MLITLEIQQNAVDRWYIELDTSWAGARKFNAFNFLDAFQGAFDRYLDLLPDDRLSWQGIKDKEDARRAMAEFVWRARNGSLDPGATHGPVGWTQTQEGVDAYRTASLAKARAAKAAKRALSGLKENPV